MRLVAFRKRLLLLYNTRGHLANHGFIETAVKGRWIFVAVIKTIGRKSSHNVYDVLIMRIMHFMFCRNNKTLLVNKCVLVYTIV